MEMSVVEGIGVVQGKRVRGVVPFSLGVDCELTLDVSKRLSVTPYPWRPPEKNSSWKTGVLVRNR